MKYEVRIITRIERDFTFIFTGQHGPPALAEAIINNRPLTMIDEDGILTHFNPKYIVAIETEPEETPAPPEKPKIEMHREGGDKENISFGAFIAIIMGVVLGVAFVASLFMSSIWGIRF